MVSPVVTTNYTVTADDLNGCASSALQIQVIVNPLPTIAITGDTALACIPADIQFTDNSKAGSPSDPITSWYWTFGDSAASTSTNPKYVFTQPGAYAVTLTVTSAGGCTSNNTSAPFVVHADSIPKSNFTTSPSVTPMPITNPVIYFTNLSSGAVSYSWSFGDGTVSVASNPVHHYAAIGIYEVKLISVNKWGCTDTFKIQTRGEGDLVFSQCLYTKCQRAQWWHLRCI